MEFSQRLYDLRRKAGLSQESLADLLGVTRQAVQKWEAGTTRPDMDNLTALAQYFNVTLDYLVTGQEPPAPQAQSTTIVNHYYQRWHYEYKSQRTLFGLPLVHIHFGDRGTGLAKGIVAIGNYAVGFLAIGGLSLGLVSIGGLSLGLLFSLAGLALGGISIGGVAIGLMAFGGSAVGLFTIGGASIGVYAVGGAAIGSQVAIGASSTAPLAIGQVAEGVRAFGPGDDPQAAAEAIRQAAAGAPHFLQNLLIFLSQPYLH